MTDLRDLLGDLAGQAKTYDVVGRAEQRARQRRWLAPVATCAGVLVVAAGTIVAVQASGDPTAPDASGTTAAAAVPALPVLQPDPPFPTSCTAEQLPVPAGYPPKSVVSGGDPTGRYIIGRGYPGLINDNAASMYGSLLWDNGVPTPLNVPGAETSPRAVNSHGEVIIDSSLETGGEAGFYYHDGTLIQLRGDDVSIRAMNESGVIVGSVTVSAGTVTGYDGSPMTVTKARPAVWRTPSSPPELLGPDDLYGSAVGIDDDGSITIAVTAAGTAELVTSQTVEPPLSLVRVAPDGSIGEVPAPAGVSFNQVRFYNGGWVLAAQLGGGDPAANLDLTFYLWHLAAPEQVTQPGFFGSAMNGHGWLAGTVGAFLTPEQTGVLVARDGTQVTLPHLTGQYSAYVPLDVRAVSDDGHTVAGQVSDTTSESRDADDIATVWHCS